MAVCFHVGQELGRNDLKIFLVDELGVPINAASVTYTIYFVDKSSGPPGVEVQIGPANLTPVNPSIGEYYASLLIPPGAASGDYRIRWRVQQNLMSEVQEIVQEFGVSDPAIGGSGQRLYSTCESDLIDKLRVLLRDNCVGAEELVEVDADGVRMVVRMDELWEVLKDV